MSLQHRIAIIVPSTVNANEAASNEVVGKWTRAAKVKFARLFGGFTAHKAIGGWVSPEHGLIEEDVTVVTSFTDEDGLEFVENIKEFAAEMAEAMGQEAVSVQIDSQLEFISPLSVAA
jgi:hypothetical protein